MAVKRVLVTRAAHQAGQLSEGLRAAGFEAVEVPVLEIQPPIDCGPLDAALRNLATYDWLIVTSANTVRSLEERSAALGVSLVERGKLQVASIGEATAAAARKVGFSIDVIPENYVAEALVEALTGKVDGTHVLLARAEIARDVIPEALRAMGAVVDVVDTYRNVMPIDAPGMLRLALGRGIDAATFTSSSSVAHLADAARAATITFPFAGVHAISIGPITTATLREFGWEPSAEASPSDIPGLVRAVKEAVND